MSAIRIVNGEYRNKPVRNQVFNLVAGLASGAKGNYVTVRNDGAFPNCPETIRIRVEGMEDYEFVSGEPVQANTVKFEQPAKPVETDEEAMARIRERFDILHEMTKAAVTGSNRAIS